MLQKALALTIIPDVCPFPGPKRPLYHPSTPRTTPFPPLRGSPDPRPQPHLALSLLWQCKALEAPLGLKFFSFFLLFFVFSLYFTCCPLYRKSHQGMVSMFEGSAMLFWAANLVC